MSTLLFALVVAASPSKPEPQAPAGEEPPATAIFLHPLTSALFSLLGSGPSVSAGAQLGGSERWSFTFDVAVVTAPGTNPGGSETFPATTSVSASAGPTLRLVGEGLRGVFLTPRVYVIGSRNSMIPSMRPGSGAGCGRRRSSGRGSTSPPSGRSGRSSSVPCLGSVAAWRSAPTRHGPARRGRARSAGPSGAMGRSGAPVR